MSTQTAITAEEAERLQEIAREVAELVDEFKGICRRCMSGPDYEHFKYRTLGHLEPAITEEHEWATRYSSIDPLETVANNLAEIAEEDED